MKKITFLKTKSFLLGTVFVLGLLSLSTFTFANTDAVTYLQSHESNAWGTMALVAAGESADVSYLQDYSGSSALDYATPILALTAVGKDPRTYPHQNFIDILMSYHTNSQLGDETLINDDVFGLLALVSAGVSLNDSVIVDTKNFILDNQNTDGGWGFSTTSSSDTNLTAAAIMALRSVGVSISDNVIVDAKNYLQSAQNNDAGFPYDPQSQWGTDSDASSDAWVISAIYALGESPSDWEQDGETPVSHLLSLQADEGYFKYQSGSNEDGFSITTTAYALIALSGNSLPVGMIDAPVPVDEIEEEDATVTYRIEGSESTICSGAIETKNVLSLVEDAASECGYTYTTADTAYGPYLTQISEDEAVGMDGWLYYVNDEAGMVGASDYDLKGGEDVLWYYGGFDWSLARISFNDDTVESGETVEVHVEARIDGVWEDLANATVYVSNDMYTSDEDGLVTLELDDGIYSVYAEAVGFIRTGSSTLVVGGGSLSGNSIDLSVNIESEEELGAIAFSVDVSSIDFGTLTPGEIGNATTMITNQGDVPIVIEGVVEGGEIFQDHLLLGGSIWENFNDSMNINESSAINVKLPVPNSYTQSGVQSGKLIFWATDNS